MRANPDEDLNFKLIFKLFKVFNYSEPDKLDPESPLQMSLMHPAIRSNCNAPMFHPSPEPVNKVERIAFSTVMLDSGIEFHPKVVANFAVDRC